MAKPSKLITDLKTVPDIIGELGVNIARAQKALNHDYVVNLKTIVDIAKDLIGKPPTGNPQAPPPANSPAKPQTNSSESSADESKPPSAEDILKDIVRQLAPVRYVYTETSLAVKLDLAQSLEIGGGGGLGGGIGALMVNASFSLAFAQQYRGTAECRTVIHPDSRSGAVSDSMMTRVKELAQKDLVLADVPQVDQAIWNALKDVRDSLKAT